MVCQLRFSLEPLACEAMLISFRCWNLVDSVFAISSTEKRPDRSPFHRQKGTTRRGRQQIVETVEVRCRSSVFSRNCVIINEKQRRFLQESLTDENHLLTCHQHK
jgi:hypothetical protein